VPQQQSWDRRFVWVGGGLAAGAAMLALEDQVIPPWPAAVVWVGAWLAFSYGCWGLIGGGRRRFRLLRVGVATLAFWVAFNFWQASAPRAELRIQRHGRIADEHLPPNRFAINVFVRNHGKSSARYQASSVASLITVRRGESIDQVDDDADRLQAELAKRIALDYSAQSEIASESDFFFTIHRPFLPEDRLAFDLDQKVILITGLIRYQDWWWFRRPPTVFCYIYRGPTQAVNACSRYNSHG
jgi:hypothetical protein